LKETKEKTAAQKVPRNLSNYRKQRKKITGKKKNLKGQFQRVEGKFEFVEPLDAG